MNMPEHQPSENKEGETKTTAQVVMEYVRTLGTAFIVVLVLRTFVFQSFFIPSGSMIPTLQVGDYIFVSKYSYGYSRYSFPMNFDLFNGRIWGAVPHRGDVAVFRFTKDTSIDYIKRVIGLPGDRIRVTGGQLYLNDQLVPCIDPHPYVAVDETHEPENGQVCEEILPGSDGRPAVKHSVLKLTDQGAQNNTPEYVVPPGHLFMMGDNRDNSADSRFMGDDPHDLGFVPMQNLVGQAKFIFFSFDSIAPAWQFWHWPAEIRWAHLFRSLT
ncbi:signal peptidase I [Acetobacter thailandicus]